MNHNARTTKLVENLLAGQYDIFGEDDEDELPIGGEFTAQSGWNECVTITKEAFAKGRNFKQIVDTILNNPHLKRWFDSHYEGNSYDLRLALEDEVTEWHKPEADERQPQ